MSYKKIISTLIGAAIGFGMGYLTRCIGTKG